MASGTDSFSRYDSLLTGSLTDPWTHRRGDPPRYSPDYALLERL